MVSVATTTTTATTANPAVEADSKSEPIERRMFQLTDFVSNHNKFYLVEVWPAGEDKVRFRASWGRVGAQPQTCEKTATWREVERQINEKLRKGYREVNLHRPQVEYTDPPVGDAEVNAAASARRVHPKVAELVDWVFAEAGEYILSFLAVRVEALGQEQIDEGRRLLAEAQTRHAHYTRNDKRGNMDALASVVQAYYNAIPTRLPARPDRDQLVLNFCKEFGEQEDRLLQLEAAIATMKVQKADPGLTYYQSLGADIEHVSPEDPAHRLLLDYIARTQVHGYKIVVRDVFSVRIPAEREAYEQNTHGVVRRELLFHGTRTQNLRHILRQGLICPRSASNGRMLGNGIYLANMASKSANYCSSSGKLGAPRMMFAVEAALGNCYIASEIGMFDRPPIGYDSICGKAGKTRIGVGYTLVNDEFVVYTPSQQTIRYLVTFDGAY